MNSTPTSTKTPFLPVSSYRRGYQSDSNSNHNPSKASMLLFARARSTLSLNSSRGSTRSNKKIIARKARDLSSPTSEQSKKLDSYAYPSATLMEIAKQSNDPRTIEALKSLQLKANVNLNQVTRSEATPLEQATKIELEQLITALDKNSELILSDLLLKEASFASHSAEGLYGVPICLTLARDNVEQRLSPQEQAKLVNDGVLQSIVEKLQPNQEKSTIKQLEAQLSNAGLHEQIPLKERLKKTKKLEMDTIAWKGDVERTDIVLQLEMLKEHSETSSSALPLHSTSAHRQDITLSGTSVANKKEVMTKKLIIKTEALIPDSKDILQVVLRQDVLNSLYVFLTNKYGITPCNQEYRIVITVKNPEEFTVHNEASYTSYTKTAKKQVHNGRTHLQATTHFKKEGASFVPASHALTIELSDVNDQHLKKQQPTMSRSRSFDALDGVRTEATKKNLKRSIFKWQRSEQPKDTLPTKVGSTLPLRMTAIEDQQYATNMKAEELENQIAKKEVFKSYTQQLAQAKGDWEKPPKTSSMSTPDKVNQRVNHLSRLFKNAPTTEFFALRRQTITQLAQTSNINFKQPQMQMAELKYTQRWEVIANTLTHEKEGFDIGSYADSSPPMSLQGQGVLAFVELFNTLRQMASNMEALTEQTQKLIDCLKK